MIVMLHIWVYDRLLGIVVHVWLPSKRSRVRFPAIPGVFNLLSSRANLHLSYKPAGPVIADYKIIMDILNIIIGAWAARQMTQVKCLWRMWSNGRVRDWAHSRTFPLLHLRHRHFTYVTVLSPTLPPIHLRHSSFYNPSAASPTSQVILQPFRCLTYVTGTSPGEPPMHRGMRKQSMVD